MENKPKLILVGVIVVAMIFAFPAIAQTETTTTNGVITTVTGPETATLGEPFTINIIFQTPGSTALHAYQYPTLTASTNLDLTNVTYTSTGTSPLFPWNNYTISNTAEFDGVGATNLYSPWAHWGYCPVMGFGDKITWDYAGFVAPQPGNYTFTLAVSGLFWSAEGGAVIIDQANPVIVTHTVTVRKPIIQANIRIRPKTINLKRRRVFVAFIKLPENYNASDIKVDTVQCEGAPALWGRVLCNRTLIVVFRTQDLIDVEPGDAVELKVTGELSDGTLFEGSDTIRIIKVQPYKPRRRKGSHR